ncbi:hypothetical protein K0F38_18485 [Bacteroides fragilis]|nr:hypothetical protein [Bacteroides fragilis]MCE8655348.1 hypothetical protein [Bacteroides fragilis]
MIKLNRYTIVALSAAFFIMCGISCTEEIEQEQTYSTKEVTLSLSTRSIMGDANIIKGSGEELIKTAYVLIYQTDGKLENVGDVYVNMPYTSGGEIVNETNLINKTWKVTAGRKDVYVILNPSASIISAIGVTGIGKEKLLDIYTNANDYQTVFRNGGLKLNGGLMTGSGNFNVAQNNNEITIPVTRRFARIDLELRKATDLNNKVTITNIKFTNYSVQTKIFESTPAWGGSISGTEAITQSSLGVVVNNDYKSIGKSYYSMPRTKETSSVDVDGKKIPVLEIDALIDGSIPQTYKAYLTELTADGTCDLTKPLPINANTIYKVKATLTRKEEDLKIEVITLPWNKESEDNQEIHPGIYNMINSYIVSPGNIVTIPVANVYKIWAWKYAKPIPDQLEVIPEIIWMDTPDLISTVSLMSSPTTDNKDHAKINVLTKKGRQGNALIGMKMTGDSTYRWSWHIWVTDEQPKTIKMGEILTMDRNLGALVSSFTDDANQLNGLLYQWGRKDPFPSSIIWMNREPTLYNKTGTTSIIKASVTQEYNLIAAIQNPTTFYFNTNPPKDWYTNVEGKQNDELWSEVKTIYDPCPEGWKIPDTSTIGLWENWTDTNFPWDYDISGIGRLLANGILYPASGSRASRNGAISGVGSNGYYWSSVIDSKQDKILTFYNIGTSVSSISDRAAGFSVRCVKE